MARQPSGRNEDGIDAQLQLRVAGVTVKKELGGAGDTVPLPRRYGLACLGEASARLDLDQGEPAAAPGDDVDLAERRPEAPGDDPIAL
jgi:hypothetical protein